MMLLVLGKFSLDFESPWSEWARPSRTWPTTATQLARHEFLTPLERWPGQWPFGPGAPHSARTREWGRALIYLEACFLSKGHALWNKGLAPQKCWLTGLPSGRGLPDFGGTAAGPLRLVGTRQQAQTAPGEILPGQTSMETYGKLAPGKRKLIYLDALLVLIMVRFYSAQNRL